jgi:formiminoglutamase
MDILGGLANIQPCLQAVMSQPEGFFPLIIGGDHAITAPAVRAYCGAHPDQQVGVIHFDAHNDVRVMDHGPTNGTPIRGILESGVKVSGENLVQFGIHGFMNASYYKRWVEGRGGTIYTARAIRKAGIEEMVGRALEITGNGTDAIYVTVDIDVLELGYAPGTAAATADGLHPVDLLEALFILGQDPRVAAIDVVELDPHRDVADITSRTFGSAILTFLAGLFLRRNDGWHGYDPTPIRD